MKRFVLAGVALAALLFGVFALARWKPASKEAPAVRPAGEWVRLPNSAPAGRDDTAVITKLVLTARSDGNFLLYRRGGSQGGEFCLPLKQIAQCTDDCLVCEVILPACLARVATGARSSYWAHLVFPSEQQVHFRWLQPPPGIAYGKAGSDPTSPTVVPAVPPGPPAAVLHKKE